MHQSLRMGFLIFVLLGLTTGCGKLRTGDSIVAKWQCSPDPTAGWQIEYQDDGIYRVTFNSGAAPWAGTYVRDGFEIRYTPSDPGQANPYYLREHINMVDRNGSKTLVFTNDTGVCERVGD